MKRRIVSLTLIFLIILSLTTGANAASSPQTAADKLNILGLFRGTGAGYELDRAPTREEAVTMLVRLLGKESAAQGAVWSHPFDDVSDWAGPYVAYAYSNGLTNGISANEFGSGSLVTASQYLTFVLRALGYSSGVDFTWDRAWELSDRLGLTGGQYRENSRFLRGDVASVSYSALTVENTSGKRLIDVLLESGAVSEQAVKEAGIDGGDDLTAQYADRVFELTNTERAKAGLQPLGRMDVLSSAAFTRAAELEKMFSHTRPDNRAFSTVLDDYGMLTWGGGEAIAMLQTTPEQVVNDWMNSPGHRNLILSPDYTHLGAGVHMDSSGRFYWVQLFVTAR